MTKLNLPEVVTTLYTLLEPLDEASRKKVVGAVSALLGQQLPAQEHAQPGQAGYREANSDQPGDVPLPQKVKTWMKQNSISEDQLTALFHIDGGKVELIAAQIPGKTVKQRVINAYMLTGLAAFLRTGESKFDDRSAREVCKSHGCYDHTNHSGYVSKGKGNFFSGSKDSGWTLTGPGQIAGATLVKTYQ